MKHIRSILAVIWFGIWIISFMGIFHFVVKEDIVWSNICSIAWGMGFYNLYQLVWASKEQSAQKGEEKK